MWQNLGSHPMDMGFGRGFVPGFLRPFSHDLSLVSGPPCPHIPGTAIPAPGPRPQCCFCLIVSLTSGNEIRSKRGGCSRQWRLNRLALCRVHLFPLLIFYVFTVFIVKRSTVPKMRKREMCSVSARHKSTQTNHFRDHRGHHRPPSHHSPSRPWDPI